MLRYVSRPFALTTHTHKYTLQCGRGRGSDERVKRRQVPTMCVRAFAIVAKRVTTEQTHREKKTVNNCWTFFEYFIFVFVVLVGLHWFVTLLVLKHACFPIILRIVSLHTIYNNHYIIFSVQIIFICRAQIAQPGMCKEFIHYITSLHITNKPGVQWQKTIENFVSFPRRIRSRGKFAHSCWQLCRMCQKCVCILLGFDSAFGSGLSPTLSVAHCGPTASCINDITSQPT